MVILLTTFFLSAIVQLSAGVVYPWHRSIQVPSKEHGSAGSSSFALERCIIGQDFLSFFKWETIDDPTHGRVNYVDQKTALGHGLVEGALCKILYSLMLKQS